ncbi:MULTISPECIES: zinc ribbon domain-containing protein YjdM [Microbacterium]|uniref:zinc ribbon domain-containing protein YjdM n=1 Tax=Microbacterium TaxID=33882 RepID=UPI001E5CEA4A|nr:zinc ribbon domain-containing protein YjdM [Microbacterium nymphoidis]MCD2499379.1 alkylphosphonate utilization protein [Microbacterium nymphoidis]
MVDPLPSCPDCGSEHTYELGALVACALCGHEWSQAGATEAVDPHPRSVLDAVGNILADGDSVIVTTSIKVAGAARPIKAGTKVRNIRLIEPVNGHDIDCRVDGFGAMLLKSSVVKRA